MKQAFFALTTGDEEIMEQFGLSESVSIGNLIQTIRTHHQMDIYTVDELWCVQLFDLNDAANDAASCVYENSALELVDVLFDCLEYIVDCLTNG